MANCGLNPIDTVAILSAEFLKWFFFCTHWTVKTG